VVECQGQGPEFKLQYHQKQKQKPGYRQAKSLAKDRQNWGLRLAVFLMPLAQPRLAKGFGTGSRKSSKAGAQSIFMPHLTLVPHFEINRSLSSPAERTSGHGEGTWGLAEVPKYHCTVPQE
jgi:hypothetical protein